MFYAGVLAGMNSCLKTVDHHVLCITAKKEIEMFIKLYEKEGKL
jgi:hypothetical protein